MTTKFHFVIDRQNIDELSKIIDQVRSDPNGWIDITIKYKRKNPPALNFAEMTWDGNENQAFVTRSLEFKAEPLQSGVKKYWIVYELRKGKYIEIARVYERQVYGPDAEWIKRLLTVNGWPKVPAHHILKSEFLFATNPIEGDAFAPAEEYKPAAAG